MNSPQRLTAEPIRTRAHGPPLSPQTSLEALQRARLRGAVWAVVAASVIVFVIALVQINARPVTKDASQNLRMAVNLAHHGVISLDPAPPFRPSMYREPLPIWVTAAAVRALDAVSGPAALSAYDTAPRIRELKFLNLIWIELLFAALCAALYGFTASIPLTLIASLAAIGPFLSASAIDGVNDLYTELPAAALLAVSSALLALAVRRPSLPLCLAVGAGFAFLTLTKAAFLYVSLLVMVAVLIAALKTRVHLRIWASAGLGVAMFTLMIGAWMMRNGVQFERWQISERGGLAVYNRALLTEMSSDEYRGSFYAWARPSIQPLMGRWLGYGPSDLKKGGRLQRLNDDIAGGFSQEDLSAETEGEPGHALTFYRRARAARVALANGFERAGDPDPMLAADAVLQGQGIRLIEAHPFRNLALTLPFLWRSAPITFPLLLAAFALAWATRRAAVGAFVLPALAAIGFSASITYFFPRFERVPHPIAIAAGAICIHWLLLRAFRRRHRTHA